jgi:Dopa 4,5-dioxygenase family protein
LQQVSGKAHFATSIAIQWKGIKQGPWGGARSLREETRHHLPGPRSGDGRPFPGKPAGPRKNHRAGSAKGRRACRRPISNFAHANTGDDLADHTPNVIWFGESEPLDLSIFN